MEFGNVGEDRFLFSGEIMVWEFICYLEFLKNIFIVGEKLSFIVLFLGVSWYDRNEGEKVIEGNVFI